MTTSSKSKKVSADPVRHCVYCKCELDNSLLGMDCPSCAAAWDVYQEINYLTPYGKLSTYKIYAARLREAHAAGINTRTEPDAFVRHCATKSDNISPKIYRVHNLARFVRGYNGKRFKDMLVRLIGTQSLSPEDPDNNTYTP